MPSPDPTGLQPSFGSGALGGVRCDDKVTIRHLARRAGQPAAQEVIRGTLACWWAVSSTRQHWMVRVPSPDGFTEMASLLVEQDDAGHLVLVNGNRLGQGIGLAEHVALGTEVRTPLSEQFLLLAATLLACSVPRYTDAATRAAE